MVQSDYIMRMIEQLAQVLAQIAFKKQERLWNDAEHEIREGCEKLLGLSYDVLKLVGIEELVLLIGENGRIEPVKGFILASLLFEEADLQEKKDDHGPLKTLYLKAATFYMEVHKTQRVEFTSRCEKKMKFILERLKGEIFPVEFRVRLFEYCELSRDYAMAENLLFVLAEEKVDSILEKGLLFYNHLLEKTDDELRWGNLSLQEAREGKQEFIDRFFPHKR